MKKHTYGSIFFAAVLVLAGCGGSSSSSSTPPGSNGSSPEYSSVDGATSLLFYTLGEKDSDTLRLIAVDADNPQRQANAEPAIVENHTAAGKDSFGGPSPYHADARNLPLAIHAGEVGVEGMKGTVSNIHHPYVVYNKPDGKLYRMATDSGDLEAKQISTEANAQVVCGAAVVPDYTDPLDALLVYQVPAEGTDCQSALWRMTSIKADSDEDPTELFDDPVFGGGRIIPLQAWDSGAADGFLTLPNATGATSAMTRFYPDGSKEVVENGRTISNTSSFQVLERSNPDGRILMRFESDPRVYLPGDNKLKDVDGGFSLGRAPATARTTDGLVIADVIIGKPGIPHESTRQLLYYDPAQNSLSVKYSDWGIDGQEANFGGTDTRAVRIVGVHENKVAWVFRTAADPADPTQRIAQLESYDLDSNNELTLATAVPGDFVALNDKQLADYFPIATEVAAEGWLFYHDAAVDHEAKIVRFNDANPQSLGSGFLFGQTWATEITPAGRRAEYVLFADVINEQLRSYAANDPTQASQVFDSPDMQVIENAQLAGFGHKMLMGVRRDEGHDVMFLDMTDGNSLKLLSNGKHAIARPVAFY